MLARIPLVVALCSSIAPAIEVEISSMLAMISVTRPIVWTAASICARMVAITLEISSVAWLVSFDRSFTSLATTAKPLSASPARAASMVAFSARRLVCSAIDVITLITRPTSALASPSSDIVLAASSAVFTASRVTRVAELVLRAISSVLMAISSIALAAVSMLELMRLNTSETDVACVEIFSASWFIRLLRSSRRVEAEARASALPAM